MAYQPSTADTAVTAGATACPAPTPASGDPTPTAPPSPGPTEFDTIHYRTFVNNSGQAASDFHVCFNVPLGGAGLDTNAPGCPPPAVSHAVRSREVDVVWASACVDPGESITLIVGAGGTMPQAECSFWTLSGSPISACPGGTPPSSPLSPPPSSPPATATPSAGGMAAMSIDMDEEVAPANTATSLGSLESCARINENGVLDADEDLVDGLMIDVTAEGVPPFSTGAVPNDPTDDSGGIVGYQFILNYSSAALTVQAQQNSSSQINLLAANPGSAIFNISDTVPDSNDDDVWYSAGLDNGQYFPESGSGVLDRLTVVTDGGATASVLPLTLTDNVHLDAPGNAHYPAATNNALVAIDMPCGPSAVTPGPTPPPTPTPTPGPPTPSPTPSPTPRPEFPMAAMSIDMDEETSPANTSSLLGSRETCRRIDENNVLDGDEDVIDGLLIDVTAAGVPAYNDNGTSGDVTDDTGGMIAYAYNFDYFASALTVKDQLLDSQPVNMLARDPGSVIFNGSSFLPDDNSDNVWYSAGLDTSASAPEDGDGVLDRLTLISDDGAAAGSYALNLTENAHLDILGYAFNPLVTNNAVVALNEACGASSPITPPPPTPTPTPEPTPTPPPNSPPTPTATPTSGLSISKTPDNSEVLNGEFAQFTITVTNHGPEPAANVFIGDHLPANNVGHWTENPDLQECAIIREASGSDFLSCNLADPLAVGASFTVKVRATALDECFTFLNNQAVAAANNSSTVSDTGSIVIMCGTRTPSPPPTPTAAATSAPTPAPTSVPQPMDAMSIDMDEEAAPANTSSVLGSRESCRRVDENDILDADEDVVDGLLVDVTAAGVPDYSNNGTPADPADDSGGIIAYVYDFNYTAEALTVQDQVEDSPAINILARNPGSTLFHAGDFLPDDNTNSVWSSTMLDTGTSQPESGDGVLDRLTLVTDLGAASGNYGVTLSGNVHLDAEGAAYYPLVTNNAVVAVNEGCGASPVILPPATPTPPPTLPPRTPPATPATMTPTPTPTPALTPMPSPVPQPMEAMSIDMDPEVAPGNTSSSLGSLELCARVNENDILDADEDVVDGLLVDVTAQGVSPYNDGGTPSDRADDTGGITGYQYHFIYSTNDLTVTEQVADVQGLNILVRTADSIPYIASDPLPDADIDDGWLSAVIDTSLSLPESGDGVLDRLTLMSDADAAAGQYLLALRNNAHLDASNAAYFPNLTNFANVAVNQACGSLISPTPTDTPPPIPQPTVTPAICPAPTQSPTPSPLAGTPGPATTLASFCNANQQSASDLHVRVANIALTATLHQNAPGCPEPAITVTTGSQFSTANVVWAAACVDRGESVALVFGCQPPQSCGQPQIICFGWTLFGSPLPSSSAPCPSPTPPPGTPTPTPRPELPMQAMSIDMNEEAFPANTSTSLGSLEQCARINENDLLDADEDSVDNLNVDVTARGIPPFNGGAPADPADDTGGVVAYTYVLNYSSSNLTVAAQQIADPAVNLMFANPGGAAFNASEPAPDDNSGDSWQSAVIDSSATPPESGDGVLDRLTLVSEGVAVTGAYPLTLTENAHLDASGTAFTPLATNGGIVAINSACLNEQPPGTPTPPPSGTPTPSPLPSGSATPSPTPTPTNTPVPSPLPATATPSTAATPTPSEGSGSGGAAGGTASPTSNPTPTPNPTPTRTPTPTPAGCILDDNDFDNDGKNNRRDRDDDNDGVRDSRDRDDDNDGIRDRRDPDDDNDGIPDRHDRNNGKLFCPDRDDDEDDDERDDEDDDD